MDVFWSTRPRPAVMANAPETSGGAANTARRQLATKSSAAHEGEGLGQGRVALAQPHGKTGSGGIPKEQCAALARRIGGGQQENPRRADRFRPTARNVPSAVEVTVNGSSKPPAGTGGAMRWKAPITPGTGIRATPALRRRASATRDFQEAAGDAKKPAPRGAAMYGARTAAEALVLSTREWTALTPAGGEQLALAGPGFHHIQADGNGRGAEALVVKRGPALGHGRR